MYKITQEGKAKVKVPEEEKVSKELPVFYNPVMKLNRDISVILLNSVENRDMQIGSPLAGTGVREIRFLLELKKGKIKNMSINDINPDAAKLIKENIKLNKLDSKNVKVFEEDANKFMIESTGFDYIDIDPFGSPNKFLNAAIERLSRGGILAVTATDTACLCGSFAGACRRKYWAVPNRDSMMHETGLRILIRKIQLIGTQYDRALTPIFSYSKDHYFRAFFLCEKGKKKADNIVKQHGVFNNAGPLWLGRLWDRKLVEKMHKAAEDKESKKFLETIMAESEIDDGGIVGFYDIHAICRKEKIKGIPSFEVIKGRIRAAGFEASRTHFSPNGVKSDIPEKELILLITH